MKADVISGGDSPAVFPIIGIGASAGGLNALECFIGELPRRFFSAIVFMQHLSTKHKSLLPGLLQNRRPDMEICEITEGLDALPGKIYLCPAGMDVGIQRGVFHVSSPSQDHIHLPIDEFFASLAEYAGERAIGVIFSGAGTDGARGIQAIRNAGGTVFVQDPATAEFQGMPLAAISTGKADGILPPEDIAREVLKLGNTAPAGADKGVAPDQWETFYRLIREKTGYNFTHYKKSVVSRRISRRMYLRGFSSVQDYLTMVAEKDSEADNLAFDLMIGVTSFFRDRLAWKALRMEVIRKLTASEEAQPVRVWTPACATGEEAYSIAMMLRHEFDIAGRKREIQVFATDINDLALEKAREGRYPCSIAADMPQDYMKKFFAYSENGLYAVIDKEIRESVVFARQDLLADPPFSRLDLIICRNLLIYFEPDAQEKCFAIFHYALREGGYLFLGNAETPGAKSALFKSLSHKKCRIYRKIEARQQSGRSFAVPFAAERSAAASTRALAEYQQSVTEFIQQALLEESGPAAVAINQHCDIVYNNGPTNRYLRLPRGAPTQNLLELLPENLRSRIRGALHRTDQEAVPVTLRATLPDDNGKKRHVTLRVSKQRESLYLVIFRERHGSSKEPEAASSEAAIDESAVRQLESELAATRQELQSNIEQLKSLNEELQSSNEELQAANEELETSREELQSLNEELITVNAQLQCKIEEQEETNNDLNNFLSSTNIPTFFLDDQFRVKRFTPAMSRLLKLIPSDVGRPIIDMSQENLGPDLIADAREVLDHLVPIKKEVAINGDWYIRSSLPYRTADNRIEGVVVTYHNVSDLKRAEERTRHLASFPQFNPNPVIEVDFSGKVTFANPATERILESAEMDKGDVRVFLPADLGSILSELGKKEEVSVYREVAVGGRIFGESVHGSRRFNVVRIYAYDITEIRQAEEVRGRLAAIVESADDAIISKDLNGTVTTWNIGAEKLFGYTAEEAVGRNVSFLTPPGRADEVPGITRRILQGEHIGRFETERVGKNGTIIQVSLTFSPIRDAAGKVVGVSKVAHDITGRRRAEDALLEAKRGQERHSAQLQTIVDNLTEGLVVADMDANLFHWNPAAVAMHGFSDMEECRRRLPEFTDIFELSTEEEGILPLDRWPLARILQGETLRDWEVRIRRHGTDWQRVFSYGGTLARDKEGGPLLAVVTVSDITDRKRSEEALKQSLGRFELLTVTAGELLQSAEPQKVVESICRKVMEYLDCHAFFNFLVDENAEKLRLNAWAGIPEEEARRIEWLDFGVAVCGCAARDASRIVAEHIPTTPDERTDLVKSYGVKAYCCHPLLGPGGKVIGTLSFGTCTRETFSEQDISMMKAVTDQVAVAMIRMRNEADVLGLSEDMARRNVELETVNKELESFIYSISHDLRAPLRSMAGFAKLLNDDYAGRLDEQGMDFLSRIQRGSEKMNQLIDDLLHLAKISRQEMERTEVDMSRKSSDLVSEMRERDPGRSVEVDIQKDLVAFADRRLIELVLSNLLGNAWKFTSKTERARIEVGSTEKEGKTVYYVRDNGAGFNPDYAEKMFWPFQRLHSETEFEGTGIGLTIVERIIHRHGGRVWAEGEKGRGSTIYFTLGQT
jgi:two-component system CheB/CheR fusion protein